jgi:hypothetical protein
MTKALRAQPVLLLPAWPASIQLSLRPEPFPATVQTRRESRQVRPSTPTAADRKKGNSSSPHSPAGGSDYTSSPCVKAYSIRHRRGRISAEDHDMEPEDSSKNPCDVECGSDLGAAISMPDQVVRTTLPCRSGNERDISLRSSV